MQSPLIASIATGVSSVRVEQRLPHHEELSWKQIFEKVERALHPPPNPATSSQLSGLSPSLKELLQFQRVSQDFSVRVELLSRAAESISSSVRRLSQG